MRIPTARQHRTNPLLPKVVVAALLPPLVGLSVTACSSSISAEQAEVARAITAVALEGYAYDFAVRDSNLPAGGPQSGEASASLPAGTSGEQAVAAAVGRIEDAYGVSMTPIACTSEPRGGRKSGTQVDPDIEVPDDYTQCVSRGLVKVNSETADMVVLAMEDGESSFINVLVGFDGRYASTG